MDYYQTLGIPRSADKEALRKAFRGLSKAQHPDRFSEQERPDAEKRYQRICNAFNVLKDDVQRRKYDKSLSPGFASAPTERSTEDPSEMVRKYYKMGMTKASQAQYEDAVDCFKRAIHYQSDAEFYLQKGLAEAHVPRLKKDAVNSLQKAMELKPENAKYQVYLVKTLAEFGLVARAKVFLERALTRFPDQEELLEIGREIDPKKYKKGLFGQLFNRK